MPPKTGKGKFKNSRTFKNSRISRTFKNSRTSKNSRIMRNVLSRFKGEFVQARRTLKLEYCTPINGETSTAQGTGAPTAFLRFLLNNIYRPYSAISTNLTPVVGVKNNSVQEYDAVEAYYNKYIVYGAKVEFKLTNLGSRPLIAGMVASCDTSNIAVAHYPSDIASRDYVYSKTIAPGILGAGTSQAQQRFTKYYDIAKIRGIKDYGKSYRCDDVNGVVFDSTTTPGSIWLNVFWGGQCDAVQQGYDVDGMIKITYYLVAYDKKNETDQPN